MFMTPPLDAKIIQQTLSDYPLEVLCFESLPSTNDYLKKTPTHSPMTLCCAETQTAGRGRLGREWASPAGRQFICFLRLRLSLSP